MDLKNMRMTFKPPELRRMLDSINSPVEMRTAKLTIEQIKKFTEEEIVAILTGEKDIGGMLPLTLHSALTNELLTRSIAIFHRIPQSEPVIYEAVQPELSAPHFDTKSQQPSLNSPKE